MSSAPNRRERLVTLVVLGCVILVAAVYTWKVSQNEREEKALDNPATRALSSKEGEAPFTDMSGSAVALDNHVGNVLIVNSWASWSPKSEKDLPLLVQVASEFAKDQVTVLAINRAEPRATAERYLKFVGVSDEVKLILDPEDRYYTSIGGYAMPETIVYDHTGAIVYHHRGAVPAETLRLQIQKALESSQ